MINEPRRSRPAPDKDRLGQFSSLAAVHHRTVNPTHLPDARDRQSLRSRNCLVTVEPDTVLYESSC
jgi:hypothetical protein